jgi:hypothetical protein
VLTTLSPAAENGGTRFGGADARENRLLWQVNSWVHRENAMVATPDAHPGPPWAVAVNKKGRNGRSQRRPAPAFLCEVESPISFEMD